MASQKEKFVARLREAMALRGMRQTDLCQAAGIKKSAMCQYVKGSFMPKSDVLDRLAKILDVSTPWLGGYDSPKEREPLPPLAEPFLHYEPGTPVRVIGSIRCGYGGMAFEETDGVEYANVRHPEEYIWLKVKGDSMEPRIHDGDLALIRLQPDLENGEIGAVILPGEEGTLKRVLKQKGNLVLQAFNPQYPPLILSGEELNEVHIVGKLMETRTKW